MPQRLALLLCAVLTALCTHALAGDDLRLAYYRQPALAGDTIVFVAEGDLWRVSADGGTAVRLTTHAAAESSPAISSDGETVAFVARYEGPAALYTMPVAGGKPRRWTWDGSRVQAVGWTADGRLLYATDAFASLPDMQLVALDPRGGEHRRIPLAQASDGCYDDTGTTLFFTRYRFQGSYTKRYQGGTAERLWRFSEGDDEAAPLTAEYRGTSRDPMFWNGRLYFCSDRDGTMNLWSMMPDGSDPRQHTSHRGWDVLSPSLSGGRVAYQLGADIRLLDLADSSDREVPILLVSDFDQTREQWVKEPADFLTAAHPSPDGDRVVLTARGQVFVAPRRAGRLVEVTGRAGARHRDARFMPDGMALLSLSDTSGEVELWRLPANGVGGSTQLTSDGDILRWQAVPSPDGTLVAHHDKGYRLWVLNTATGANTLLDTSELDSFSGLAWSPDSRWLAAVSPADNLNPQVRIYRADGTLELVATSDRAASYNPVFSRDGKWLFVLSDRHLSSVVKSPWGTLQPEPFFDRQTKVYTIALQAGERFPFAPPDELHPGNDKGNDKAEKDAGSDTTKTNASVTVTIEADGLASRLYEVPIAPANISDLDLNDTTLFWLEREAGSRTRTLKALKIGNDEPEPEEVAANLRSYELSGDGSTLLLRTDKELHLVEAKAAKAELGDKTRVDLSRWTLSVTPLDEWRQMFLEAWRLERDYFYDRAMHGLDWEGIRDRYLPLVDRVRSREELSDLLAQMAGELSAVHTFVRGGDLREGDDEVEVASLGARLECNQDFGGCLVAHRFLSDPDQPERRSPLAAPAAAVDDGDVITRINGRTVLEASHPAALLRNQADRQVLLEVRPADGGDPRQVVVVPITAEAEADLRYHEWEYSRRLRVEELSSGDIGYVHLRAMGSDDIADWARGFYPVFNRQGLIVDVRHNRGGNIDSWIVEKLMRKVWGAWSDPVGRPSYTNMQYGFRGHLVVLCDAWTASDGEAFLEAVRRLDLGPIIGTRTWGGGIWLTSSNVLVDGGIATAAEFGLFGPEGQWLIEDDGVEPDITVDNLPHATFSGSDAQLDAAIELLKQRIAEQPVPPLTPPPAKDRSLEGWQRR